MGLWTYYAPFGLGLLITLVLHETVQAHAPALPEWADWPFVVVVGLVAGLLCQLMMIGVQGAFAQVLPVPIGRSIRGRSAVVGGCLMIGCVALAAVALLLQMEEFGGAALGVGVLSGLCAVGAIITYVWCWPMAARDFGRGKV
jgi:hypothetical protein